MPKIITISEIEKENIKSLFKQGFNREVIAKKLNITEWTIRKFIKEHNLSVLHPLCKPICIPISMDSILVKNSTYGRSSLSRRIIEENIIEYKCSICSNDGYWNNKYIRLQLDHINGIGTDHRIENLRFLCANCHSQTPTYGVKNVKKKRVKKTKKKNAKKLIFQSYTDYNPKVGFRKKKNKIWNIPIKELTSIVKLYNTFSDIFKHYNFPYNGANHKALKERLFWEKIDFSHIKLGWGLNKGIKKEYIPKYKLDEVLIDNSSFTRFALKIRLFKEKLIQNICCICGQLPYWEGQNLSLQLDHINGKSTDNRIENLRILCPNCHSQTFTYVGKNSKLKTSVHLVAAPASSCI